MTYYEELDVSSSASADEIRRSYKSLVRLLHPDQCSDPSLKRLAELQMRRLNYLLAVLTDPEKRLRYDAGLQPPSLPARRYVSDIIPPQPPRCWGRSWLVGFCVWLLPIAALVLFLAGMMYYESGVNLPAVLSPFAPDVADNSAPPRVETAARAPEPDSPPASDSSPHNAALLARLSASEAELSKLRAEHRRTLALLALPARPTPHSEPLPEPPPAMGRPALDPRPLLLPARSERALVNRPAAKPATFAGNWYYVPASAHADSLELYAPEYIELRVSESAGALRGRYQARYRITDRALVPDVAFQFEGAGAAPTAQFSWAGPGGAAGTVLLRLVSAGRLEVTWTASRLSSALNLASGTAQLIRQQESRN